MPFPFRHALIPMFLSVALCGLSSAAGADEPADTSTPAAGFSEVQLSFVKSWIQERVPECPGQTVDAVANHFLEDLKANRPEKFEQLLSPDFPEAKFDSELLRDVAAHLPGGAWTQLREQLALRRIRALIEAGNGPDDTTAADAAALVAKVKAASDIDYGRLLDGRVDDDDLASVLRKDQRAGESHPSPEAAKPRVLTAADIVSEFSRHNQEGTATQQLYAYVSEGSLESSEGTFEVVVLKLRPDFVRVVVEKDGKVQSVIAGHGGRFWKQVPGSAPFPVPQEAAAEFRHLGEFLDPLFTGEGYTFERLPDGQSGSSAYYRIGVRRADGSEYTVQIDSQTFREIGRERPDGSTASSSDFRVVAGVTISFREETKDKLGKGTVFTLERFTPNPGLAQVLFDEPGPRDQGYFAVGHLLAESADRSKAKP
jgi:hypothetical protein